MCDFITNRNRSRSSARQIVTYCNSLQFPYKHYETLLLSIGFSIYETLKLINLVGKHNKKNCESKALVVIFEYQTIKLKTNLQHNNETDEVETVTMKLIYLALNRLQTSVI